MHDSICMSSERPSLTDLLPFDIPARRPFNGSLSYLERLFEQKKKKTQTDRSNKENEDTKPTKSSTSDWCTYKVDVKKKVNGACFVFLI